MSNIASLVPITKGDPRGGRVPGQTNKITRVIKRALLLAAEKSKHSKDKSLESYLTFIADERPELFCSLLGRVIPIQAKIKTEDRFDVETHRLTLDMPLDLMVKNFEMKIKSGYQPPRPSPPLIEHDADDGDDDDG